MNALVVVGWSSKIETPGKKYETFADQFLVPILAISLKFLLISYISGRDSNFWSEAVEAVKNQNKENFY